ncbi:acetyl/propionyl/methylcrotonyl-CoA carboxylase subunit alpha [Musicola paradisiaca]|uniref:Biotin carboxylase n=1 Tax=Musicola paradisiaca (strain Ech703) TaxID=579405 RepID=C6CDW0_MUSP7|nr:biotin carboxylase N-terminal domain-containing protein [Musicola paradisiaca]ACS87054.1 Carbamoyl-phosphate synthase L chain ATP-binding [Musicola paradisiaca Ech703]
MKKVLIANRGEIAVRIIRACRDYGLQSVAVYADSDSQALHVSLADEAWVLPGQRPDETYLNIERLIAVAQRSGADAVHPGYGFLSERAEFARAVQDAGLVWIGPDPASIDMLGDKVKARQLAHRVGAPLVAGTTDPVGSADEVVAFAREYGLPIAIKAAYGGGGRGMKVAWRLDEVAELYDSAVREAITAFGRGECFVEQFLDKPRHIEAQVLADRHGNVVVLGTRDCSLQRRNQKLVEEAPAPFLNGSLREQIELAARNICAAAGYIGAGTVEFLLSRDGRLSFLEVNTRLQVEHTVTEETTGIDLVLEQFRIAEGHALTLSAMPEPLGHAFEFRLNAEDAGRGFLPTPGTVTRFDPPAGPGIRLDSGVKSGSTIPGAFDSLMAKLIVSGPTRAIALARARRALAEFSIDGVASVLPFHQAVVDHPDFTGAEGFKVHTRWIETDFAADIAIAPRPLPGSEPEMVRTFIELDGRRHQLGIPAGLLSGGDLRSGAAISAAVTDVATDTHACLAPISGLLQCWQRQAGEQVQEGEVIAVMEAMKMETSVTAHRSGKLEPLAAQGEMVQAGAVLARITAG